MLRPLLLRWIGLALAFAVTSGVLDGMSVSGGVLGYLWVSALFGVVNALLGTVLRLLTLPLTILTLGLFSLIVNGVLLDVTDALSDHLTIDHFWWTAIWAALIISCVAVVLDAILTLVLRRSPVAAAPRPARTA